MFFQKNFTAFSIDSSWTDSKSIKTHSHTLMELPSSILTNQQGTSFWPHPCHCRNLSIINSFERNLLTALHPFPHEQSAKSESFVSPGCFSYLSAGGVVRIYTSFLSFYSSLSLSLPLDRNARVTTFIFFLFVSFFSFELPPSIN